jgi:hypothetical protein
MRAISIILQNMLSSGGSRKTRQAGAPQDLRSPLLRWSATTSDGHRSMVISMHRTLFGCGL